MCADDICIICKDEEEAKYVHDYLHIQTLAITSDMMESGKIPTIPDEKQILIIIAENNEYEQYAKRVTDFIIGLKQILLKDIWKDCGQNCTIVNLCITLGASNAIAVILEAARKQSKAFPYLKMIHNKKSDFDTVANIADNYLQIFRHDEKFACVRYNTLSGCPFKQKGMKRVKWTDADDACTRTYIEAEYGISNRQKSDDAFAQFLHEREVNPVEEMICSFKWDGTERVSTFLSRWMGAEDTPYTRECSRLIFAGAVARGLNPGCKFDDVIVLIGSQGGAKSTMVSWLALDDEFYTSCKTISGQKGYEAIQGKWYVELDELLAVVACDKSGTKIEENTKAYLSTRSDTYRKPYERRPCDNPRTNVFVGTTNRDSFLTDKTGNRRWFPVMCKANGRELYAHEQEIRDYIRQCYAEMKHYRDTADDRSRPVEREDLLDTIRRMQTSAEVDDYKTGLIDRFVSGKKRTCCVEVWEQALHEHAYSSGFTIPSMTTKDSRDIGEILRNKLHWRNSGNSEWFEYYGKQKAFYPPTDEDIPP